MRTPSIVLAAVIGSTIAGCDSDIGFAPRNKEPVVTITFPAADEPFYEGVAFEAAGTVSDEDNEYPELLVSWFVDDVEVCAPTAPHGDGTTTCSMAIDDGEHEITLEATDPPNELGQQRLFVLGLPTEAPVVAITGPALTGVYYDDVDITLTGTVTDLEDGTDFAPVDAEPKVWWEINGVRDDSLVADVNTTTGAITTVGRLPADPGLVVKLVARDSSNKTGSATLAPLRVFPPNTPPTCEITAPADDAFTAVGTAVFFRGTVADANINVRDVDVTWRSSLQGVIGTSTPSSAGEIVFPTSDLVGGAHTITLEARDELGALCQAMIDFTVGNPPVVQVRSPVNGALIREGESVALTVEVADVEDPPEDLTVEWESDQQGAIGSNNADVDGFSTINTSSLIAENHVLTVTVTDTLGLATRQQVAVLVNTPPTQPTVAIDPCPAQTGDNLTAALTVPSTDPNFQVPTYSYRWSKNGVVDPTEQQASVPSSKTTRGDVWRVEVTPNDGFDDGPIGTAQCTIVNTPPVAPFVTLGSGPFYKANPLTCDVPSTSDDDGDPVTLRYAWTVNGAAAAPTTRTLDGTWFDRGDEVRCTATPFDGFQAGDARDSSTVTIENSVPAVEDVEIDPAAPQSFETLNCDYTFDDADGDPDTSTFAWFVNGAVVSGATSATLSTSLDEGDNVRCVVTPNDGSVDGLTGSSTVTVVPSTPSVSNVQIGPSPATAGVPLTCTYAFSDPQNDANQSLVEWLVGSTVIGTGATLSPGPYHKGDSVICRVTPKDGTFTGAPVTATRQILNTAPTRPNCSIAPVSPIARANNLVCSVDSGGQATDVDADTLQYRFTWRRDGATFGGATDAATSSTVTATDLGDEETWSCDCFAFDGDDFGARDTSDVFVLRGVRAHLVAGENHSCAVYPDSRNDCWTKNDVGQSNPPAGLRSIAVGRSHTCGVRISDDRIVCVGSPPTGTIPTGAFERVVSGYTQYCGHRADGTYSCIGVGPTFPTDLGPVKVLSLRFGHSCAILPDDTIRCWGNPGNGQTTPPAGRFSDVSVGNTHTCALSAGGSIACFGNSANNRLAAPTGNDFVQVSAGGDHTCALRRNGTLLCWGDLRPNTIAVPTDTYAFVGAGALHTCAVTRAGVTRCWGDAADGKLTP